MKMIFFFFFESLPSDVDVHRVLTVSLFPLTTQKNPKTKEENDEMNPPWSRGTLALLQLVDLKKKQIN